MTRIIPTYIAGLLILLYALCAVESSASEAMTMQQKDSSIYLSEERE